MGLVSAFWSIHMKRNFQSNANAFSLLEAAHTLSTWVEVYKLSVTLYGNLPAIDQDSVAVGLLFAFSGIIGSTVQVISLYYLYLK